LFFLLLSNWFFIVLRFPPSFLTLFYSYFFSLCGLSLAYPNLLGTKRFSCCCIKLPLLLNKILIFIMLATHIEFICVVFILPLTCVNHVRFHVPGIEYILEATFY
jgi:hypothetical protein